MPTPLRPLLHRLRWPLTTLAAATGRHRRQVDRWCADCPADLLELVRRAADAADEIERWGQRHPVRRVAGKSSAPAK